MQLDNIQDQLSQFDWYHSHVVEPRKVTIYVNYMNHNVLTAIPDKIGDKQTVLCFSSHVLAKADDYSFFPQVKKQEELGEQEDVTFDDLKELDYIISVAGIENTLHLFYEIHDSDDNVTQVASAFPLEAKAMAKLYDKYGFDVLYDYLEQDDEEF